jgi:hypothetical protein
MYHHYNFPRIFLFPAIASIIHASHFPLQFSHLHFHQTTTHHTGRQYNLPANNEITERVGSSIIKPPKHSDVRINGQYFTCQPNPLCLLSPGRAISIPIQATPFFSSYTYHINNYYTHSNRSVTICIHNPPSLPAFYIYPIPAITPRDEIDRLIISFSYPPHSFLFYSFNLYYFANPSSRRLRWRVAWRLPSFLVLFYRPYKPRLLPLFPCTLSNISQLQSRHVAAILVSHLQLFCVFTIINPQKPEGLFHHFLVPKSVSHLIIQVPELLQILTVRTKISYQS